MNIDKDAFVIWFDKVIACRMLPHTTIKCISHDAYRAGFAQAMAQLKKEEKKKKEEEAAWNSWQAPLYYVSPAALPQAKEFRLKDGSALNKGVVATLGCTSAIGTAVAAENVVVAWR